MKHMKFTQEILESFYPNLNLANNLYICFTKKEAKERAKKLGWTQNSVVFIERRFECGYYVGCLEDHTHEYVLNLPLDSFTDNKRDVLRFRCPKSRFQRNIFYKGR